MRSLLSVSDIEDEVTRILDIVEPHCSYPPMISNWEEGNLSRILQKYYPDSLMQS